MVRASNQNEGQDELAKGLRFIQTPHPSKIFWTSRIEWKRSRLLMKRPREQLRRQSRPALGFRARH